MKRIKGKRHKTEKNVIFVILFMLLMYSPVVGQEKQGGGTENAAGFDGLRTVDGGLAPSAVGLFRRYISPIDGDRCPMYPSCSQYSLEAFNKHGLLMGWIMTCDRLLRCGRDELKTAPRIMVDGSLRCYDSVEDNDFWLAR